MTCELDVHADRSGDVCVVPHWDISSTLIEHFDAPRSAMLRHAEIARRLRDAGWMVTEHASSRHTPAAA